MYPLSLGVADACLVPNRSPQSDPCLPDRSERALKDGSGWLIELAVARECPDERGRLTQPVMRGSTRRAQLFISAASLALAASIELAAVSATSAEVTRQHRIQRWDYESGNFSQWDRMQALPGDAMIVTAPVRQGRFAAKFTVHPGDDPISSNGERSEAVASQSQTDGYTGAEAWYGWSTLFPSNFNPVPDSASNIFIQWHETRNDGCGPPIVLEVATSRTPPEIKFRVRGGRLSRDCRPEGDRTWYTVPLALNRWFDFVLHVKWSPDASVGFVELWVNGKKVVPKSNLATLYEEQGVYLKEGFYRRPYNRTSTVYHDALRRGMSYSDVRPAG